MPKTGWLVVLMAGVAAPLAGQGHRLEDVGPFLMPRDAEIALARSAAPWDLGREATVWVLTREGYEKAADGTNGFQCFVGRGWSGPIMVKGRDGTPVLNPDTFDRTVRAPHCFNAVASESVLQWHRLLTRALLDGTPAERVHDVAAVALQDGRLRIPGPQAFAYMTSSQQHLADRFGSWRPHIMLYQPFTTNAVWGSRGFNHDFPSVVEAGTAWAVTVIPIGRFADGTAPTWRPTP